MLWWVNLRLRHGGTVSLNPAHIVAVDTNTDGYAIVHMSTGTVFESDMNQGIDTQCEACSGRGFTLNPANHIAPAIPCDKCTEGRVRLPAALQCAHSISVALHQLIERNARIAQLAGKA